MEQTQKWQVFVFFFFKRKCSCKTLWKGLATYKSDNLIITLTDHDILALEQLKSSSLPVVTPSSSASIIRLLILSVMTVESFRLVSPDQHVEFPLMYRCNLCPSFLYMYCYN